MTIAVWIVEDFFAVNYDTYRSISDETGHVDFYVIRFCVLGQRLISSPEHSAVRPVSIPGDIELKA